MLPESSPENNFALFDAYLRNELDAGQKAEFNLKLDTDQDFAQDFESYKLVVAAILDEADLKGKEEKFAKMGQEIGEKDLREMPLTTSTYFEEIDRYLSEEMPEDERISFEQQLARNPALATAFEEEKLIIAAVEQERFITKRKDKFAQIGQRIQQEPVTPWNRLLVAASLAALVLITAVVYFRSGESYTLVAATEIPVRLLNTSGLGYAPADAEKKIQVRLYSSEKYSLHYQYHTQEQVLEVYASNMKANADMVLAFDNDYNQYFLIWDEKRYFVALKTEPKPVPLELAPVP